MSSARPSSRAQMTVRLDVDSKKLLDERAQQVGLDGGVCARIVLELYIQKLRNGADCLGALAELQAALGLQDREAA